jgi:hypothetical protein
VQGLVVSTGLADCVGQTRSQTQRKGAFRRSLFTAFNIPTLTSLNDGAGPEY